ncbi:MAG TPA: CbtA family protein [Catenuloplanes sp.]|jgi:predicted cobalt transporter CbtA
MPTLTFGAILGRGLIAGAAAGVTAATAGLLVVQPPLRAALAIEHSRTAGTAAHHEDMFTRPVQMLGGAIAALAVGLALGAIFAVVFARWRHRLPADTDFGRVVLLATAGFGCLALLPALKYPANPPGVGDPDTVTTRTVAYLSLIAAALAVTCLAFLARQRLARRGVPAPQRGALVAVGLIIGYAALLAVLPRHADPVPADLPAELLWRFRLASLAELAVLWATLGLTMGLLVSPRRVDGVERDATAGATLAR